LTIMPEPRRFTYADLLQWEDDTRRELVDGVPYALSPPTEPHQRVQIDLLLQIGGFLLGKPCRLYSAPFDVRLFEGKDDSPAQVDTVVQPDLMVVCDRDKIDRRGVRGAPDLVVEVLSASTRRLDRVTKYRLYQRAGVPEYWIVDPEAKTVAVHRLEDGQYGSPEIYLESASLPVQVLPGCTVELGRVFAP